VIYRLKEKMEYL